MVWCKQVSISQLPFFSLLYFSIILIRLGAIFLQRFSSKVRLSASILACFSRCSRKLREVCKRINKVTFTCLLIIHSFIKHCLRGHEAPGFAWMNKVGCLSQSSSIVWGKRYDQVNLYTICIHIKSQYTSIYGVSPKMYTHHVCNFNCTLKIKCILINTVFITIQSVCTFFETPWILHAIQCLPYINLKNNSVR